MAKRRIFAIVIESDDPDKNRNFAVALDRMARAIYGSDELVTVAPRRYDMAPAVCIGVPVMIDDGYYDGILIPREIDATTAAHKKASGTIGGRRDRPRKLIGEPAVASDDPGDYHATHGIGDDGQGE